MCSHLGGPAGFCIQVGNQKVHTHTHTLQEARRSNVSEREVQCKDLEITITAEVLGRDQYLLGGHLLAVGVCFMLLWFW